MARYYELQLKQRTPSERLRYLAGRLRDGDERLFAIVALEAWADELQQAEAASAAEEERREVDG